MMPLKKHISFSIICSECKSEDKKIFKEEESIENSWFNWKYIITLEIFLKKTYVENLD